MSAAVAAASHALLVEDFTAVRRNSLRGFVKVTLPSGMILSDVALHLTNDQFWASPPSKPILSREGVALRDEAGKVRYVPVVAFASKELRDKFSAAVIAAVQATFPEALA